MTRTLTSTRGRLVAAIVAVGALVGGATAVRGLSANGAAQYDQGAGVSGRIEVGDRFGGALAVGDFDDDGHGDVIAGAAHENLGSKADAGVVHVLYGSDSGLDTSRDITIDQGTPKVPGRSEADDRFGSTVAVGDFDGDGRDDAVVGAPGEDGRTKTDSGAVTILYGSRSGLRGKRSATFSASTTGVKGPAEAHANLGAALAVGDFDGDGYDDVAIGAPGSGAGPIEGAGAVHILYGSRRGIRPADDQRLHQGLEEVSGAREADDGFGSALAAGDFDGDGRDDLAVGIPGQRVDGHDAAGAVQVFSGSKRGIRPESARLITQATGDLRSQPGPDELFGSSLAAGDFDGNGREDLAVATPNEQVKNRPAAGLVHVLRGSKSGIRTTGSKAFDQGTPGVGDKVEPGDGFGTSLAAGDFNRNGKVDLAIGVPGERYRGSNGAGLVHVLFGSNRGIRADRHQQFRPGSNGVPGKPKTNGGFAHVLATGDIDGDGRSDLVVGAPGQKLSGDANAGSLTVIYG